MKTDVEKLEDFVRELEEAGKLPELKALLAEKMPFVFAGRPPLCRKYLGDNDGTSPELGCIRLKGHDGLCDNVSGDPD